MIRQAHTYMVGAVSGATLIAIAIAAFVLLVSAQVFRDWPIAALGDSGGGSAGVSDARAAGSGPVVAPATAGPASESAPATAAANARPGGHKSAGGAPHAVAVDGTAATPAGQVGGRPGESGGGGGSPTTSPPSSGAASPNPSGNPSSPNSSGGSGSTATTPSGKVAGTVNSTVGTVDETVTGGALEKSGVTGVTEGVVNGVVGPESPVGKVVDETVGAVDGLLHPNH